MINPSSRFARRDGVLKQNVSGSLVLFDQNKGHYFALSGVAGLVWDLCDGRRVSEMIAKIHEEFDEPSDAIARDVLTLVRDLVKQALVLELDAAS